MTTVEKLLPAFYLLTTQHAELQRVIFNVLRRADNDMAFTLRQLFPSTASGWGLDIWEEAYGIPTDRTMSEQRRRDRVIAKVRGAGVTTKALIQAIAQSYSQCPAEVIEESALYRFMIWYVGTIEEPENVADLIASVNEIKPAHLDWLLGFRQTTEESIRVGSLPRQGDIIIWEVDCTA